MADFTASNGVTVTLDADRDYLFNGGTEAATWVIRQGGPTEVALREFFAYQDENNPHHLAQVGEVWDLDSTQGLTYRVMVIDTGEDVHFVSQDGDYYGLTNPLFTGGVKVA